MLVPIRRAALVCLLPVACFDPGAVGPATDDGATTDGDTGSPGSSTGTASAPTSGSATTPGTSSSGASTDESPTSTGSTEESSSGDSSTSGTVVCDAGEFGPACSPCTCVHGSCDDGAQGTGACACEPGFTGDACDALDCGPGGTLEDDGSCTTPLVAVQDAQLVSDEYAMDNFGTEEFTPFAVGRQNDYTGNQLGRAILEFDLSAFPPGAVVDAAVLHIKEYDNFAGFPMTLAVRGATSDWDEDDVTWTTQPDYGPTVLDTAQVGCCGETHELEVTPPVELAMQKGLPAVSLVLLSESEVLIGGVRWFMREGEGVSLNGIVGAAPRLVVQWRLP